MTSWGRDGRDCQDRTSYRYGSPSPTRTYPTILQLPVIGSSYPLRILARGTDAWLDEISIRRSRRCSHEPSQREPILVELGKGSCISRSSFSFSSEAGGTFGRREPAAAAASALGPAEGMAAFGAGADGDRPRNASKVRSFWRVAHQPAQVRSLALLLVLRRVPGHRHMHFRASVVHGDVSDCVSGAYVRLDLAISPDGPPVGGLNVPRSLACAPHADSAIRSQPIGSADRSQPIATYSPGLTVRGGSPSGSRRRRPGRSSSVAANPIRKLDQPQF